MWESLWRNATLATMAGDGASGLIEAGALAAEAGRIAWLGPEAALPGAPATLAHEVHDLGGRLLTPGLVDPHTHLVFLGPSLTDFEILAAGGGRADLEPAGAGIIGMALRTREASEEALFEDSAGRIKALIANGVTTVESKSGSGLDFESELRLMRVSRALGRTLPVDVVSTFLGAHGLPPEYAGRRDDYVDFLVERLLPTAIEADLVDQVDGFCDQAGFSHAQMSKQFDLAAAHGLPVKLHADQYTDFGAGAPVAKYGGVSADHLEYASDAIVRAMAEAGTVATLIPGAHWSLHETRRPPVALFRVAGVPMALATNCNPVSSPATSPTVIMHMACHLFGLTAAEALAGFTRNGAKALGLEADRGSLEVGKLADLAVWEARVPAELSYWISGTAPVTVIKRGRVVHERAPTGPILRS
jgi:imidazolonepropionase